MPKGVVHYAQTLENLTTHLTIGFHRGNVQWLNLVRALLANLTTTSAVNVAAAAALPLHVSSNNSNYSAAMLSSLKPNQMHLLRMQTQDKVLQSIVQDALKVLEL